MNDLRTRITTHVDELVPPLDVEELVATLVSGDEVRRLRDGPRRPRPWWRTKWIAVAAGAAAVLVLIGAAALLSRSDPEPPVITQDSTPAPTTLLPSPESGGWVRHDIAGNDLRMVAVLPGGPGLVAAGHTFTQGDVWGRTQIWTSPDGAGWTAVAPDTDPVFEEGHFAGGLLRGPDRYLVFGIDSRQGGTALWTSADALQWTHRPSHAGEAAVRGLTLGSGEFLLYGAEPDCSFTTETCMPADVPRILMSPDGETWEEIATPVAFTAIVETDDGALLAAARRGIQPTTWLSRDGGRSWTRHSDDFTADPGEAAGEVWTMLETPDGLVAAGLDADKRPVLWRSSDGRSFAAVHVLAESAPVFGELSTVEGLLSIDGDLFAAGTVQGEPAIWTSSDAETWQRVDLTGTYLDGGQLAAITSIDSRPVAVGQHRFSIGGEALVLGWEPSG